MMKIPTLLTFLCMICPVTGDDFKRERRGGDKDAAKDALEAKAPPALEVTGWMNTPDGKALKLADLKGKVVVLDFWGVW